MIKGECPGRQGGPAERPLRHRVTAARGRQAGSAASGSLRPASAQDSGPTIVPAASPRASVSTQ